MLYLLDCLAIYPTGTNTEKNVSSQIEAQKKKKKHSTKITLLTKDGID